MLLHLAQVAAASPTAGAEALPHASWFVDAILNNWPVVVALISLAYFMGRMSRGFESMGEAMKAFAERIDKRLDSHSETLDDHTNRLSATEAITGALSKKAGLS